MSVALGLFRLQQVDTRISQTESRLRKIQETLDNDAELKSTLVSLKAAEEDEHRHEHDRRMAEEGARDKQVKIQQAESSLYGGKVHNPKELQDLEADVRSLKKNLAAMEEQELDAMLKLETAQAALTSAREDLSGLETRRGQENGQLLLQHETLSRELADLQTERHAALSAIDAGVLNRYEILRQDHRGIAVTQVTDNTCGGCGATITASLQQNSRHSAELVYCPSCGRILFAP